MLCQILESDTAMINKFIQHAAACTTVHFQFSTVATTLSIVQLSCREKLFINNINADWPSLLRNYEILMVLH